MISNSHSFNGPFHLQTPPQGHLFPLIQNEPSTSAHDLSTDFWQQKRNGGKWLRLRRLRLILVMGPGFCPTSVPCTPAVDLPGPNLNRQPEFKIRSNSLAAKTIVDLDYFDPLINASIVQTSLETVQSPTEQSFEDNYVVVTPTNSNDLAPTLDSNATSYVLLDKTLQLFQSSGSNYAKEAELLADYTRSIAFNNNATSSLFLAPSVNYNTTKAEQIKLVVTEDKT